MKKVLILGPDLRQPGGVAAIYNSLQLQSEGDIDYFVVNNLQRHSRVTTFFKLLGKYMRFRRQLRQGGYGIVHVNPSLQKKSFFRDAGFIFISKLLKRRTLVFFHGWREDFEKKVHGSRFKSYLFRKSYARADGFIVLSKIFRDKLVSLGVSPVKKYFVETTVADSTYLEDFELDKKFCSYKKEIKFLFLSRIEKEKGIYIAIDAFREFSKKHPDRKATLEIAGDGSELNRAKEYITREGIQHVHFLGNVSGEAKKSVLLDSHIMIFPSYTEGLPNCILEGMLYGMPIISRVTGGIPDVITQHENGFLSESLEPGPFADFMSGFAADEGLYQAISKRNHEVAMEKYTTEKVRARILGIYRQFDE